MTRDQIDSHMDAMVDRMTWRLALATAAGTLLVIASIASMWALR